MVAESASLGAGFPHGLVLRSMTRVWSAHENCVGGVDTPVLGNVLCPPLWGGELRRKRNRNACFAAGLIKALRTLTLVAGVFLEIARVYAASGRGTTAFEIRLQPGWSFHAFPTAFAVLPAGELQAKGVVAWLRKPDGHPEFSGVTP